MRKQSNRRISVATVPGPSSIVHPAVREIKQPANPTANKSHVRLFPNYPSYSRENYYLNNGKLAAIAANSVYSNGCELAESTSVHNLPPINDMALIVVSYGFDITRYNACKKALERLDHADPAPGKKIFVEATQDEPHFKYLEESGWEYHCFNLTDNMDGLFQKEPLWNIGSKQAFSDKNINKIVLVDGDCAFHDNSWAYFIDQGLLKYSFIQPYAAIFYSGQNDAGMNKGTFPSIAYCINNNQAHHLATPGGAFACTRDFFDNVLGGAWPVFPTGAGDAKLWEHLFGHTPITCAPETKHANPFGKFQTFKVGYVDLLLNHFYHGPMANRMYCTRGYIGYRCINGTETRLNQDGLLEWSDNKFGRIMKKSMYELKRRVLAYLQVGRRFTTPDAKVLFKNICSEEIGSIDENHPLKIVTVFRKDGIHTKQQIDELKAAVKRTFKCPYEFRVVTNSKDIFPDNEMIYCDLPSYKIPVGYEWIMATSILPEEKTSILYIEPGVKMFGTCSLSPCGNYEVYLTHHGKSWNTSLMYFNDLTAIYRKFCNYVYNNPIPIETIYPESVNFLISQTENTLLKIRHILFYLDYESKKVTEKTTNFLI